MKVRQKEVAMVWWSVWVRVPKVMGWLGVSGDLVPESFWSQAQYLLESCPRELSSTEVT